MPQSSTPSSIEAALQRHPDSPAGAVRRIGVRLARSGGMISLCYIIEAQMDSVRVPPPRPRRVADRLWQHTCCEVFIAQRGAPGYREFNFSPSGEWAAYAFTDYRQGGPLAASDPGIAVHATDRALELTAAVDVAFAGDLALGLSAVIEQRDGRLSYWSLRHPPGQPDFHRREAFTLELR